MLGERAAAGRCALRSLPARGTMFLSQVRLTTGMHLVGIAEPMPGRAASA